MQNTTSYLTSETPSDSASDAATIQFVIQSMLAWVRTAGVVQVKSVSNAGGVSPIGYVSMQPLVGQVDGQGVLHPHGLIYNVPYLRVQGGANAVILDPHVGDIGIAVFCDRDISAVKSTQSAAQPGSQRRHDMSDAVYLYSVIGAAPTQYIQFNADGISVISPTAVTIQAPQINSKGTWNHDGTITSTGDMTAAGISLDNHMHGGVQAGGSDTGPPT